MSELADIIEAKIEEFDSLREVFFSDDAKCFLLDQDGGETAYVVKLEVENGWYLDTKAKKLLVATLDTNFAKKLELSGHFSVSGRVYEILEDDGEGGDGRVPPEGEEPWWKLLFKRTGQTFTPE